MKGVLVNYEEQDKLRMDYKDLFLELLKQIQRDKNEGLIPAVIAEGLLEFDKTRITSAWVAYHIARTT